MSHEDPLERVRAYIARIDSEREEQGVALSQQDFESIASELGLDAKTRSEMESRAAEHMIRGERFFSQQLHPEDVQSFEIARDLEPWSLKPIQALARAHTQAWNLEHEQNSQAEGRLYCLQWIERDPSAKEPYALMKELEQPSEETDMVHDIGCILFVFLSVVGWYWMSA